MKKRAAPAATSSAGESETRCGYVAIIGAPNAGKSTLINALVGQKVAIVSPKVQTTRHRITGICMKGRSQLVLLDTPGIFQAPKRFEQAMVGAAWKSAAEADIVLFLLDGARGLDAAATLLLDNLRTLGKPTCAVINKIDQMDAEAVLRLTRTLMDTGIFAECFMVSAKTGQGVDYLTEALAARVPPGPYLFPEDTLTDQPLRLLAAEITRETLFLTLLQEVPYSIWVETDSYEERKDGSVKIQQTIFVERESQKSIIIGEKGQMLKQIGTRARREMGRLIDGPVHLFLFVKVAPEWKEKPEAYRAIGLEYTK